MDEEGIKESTEAHRQQNTALSGLRKPQYVVRGQWKIIMECTGIWNKGLN